jgi:CheY-like chemotaxis protein
MQDQLSILIVDDEPGIRITIAGILEDEGYNVIVA